MVSPIGTWMTEPAPARRRWSVASRTAPVVSVDSVDSLVTVENPDGSTVTVPALSGVYSEGSLVRLTESPDGRVVFASTPDSIPDGAEVEPVGEQGALLLESHAKAVEAWDEASAARESIVEVDTSAKAAEQAAHNAEIAAQLTQQALDAATEAQELENARLEGLAVDADAKADAAQARADELAEQAQAAMTAAQQAQTSADGKALVAYSDYQPATIAGQKIIWFEPGSVPMLFDGEEWRSVQPGDGVVEALDIGTATVGELSGMRIKAGTASVDILIPGENARWTSSGLTIYHPLTPEQQQVGVEPTDWELRSVALNLTSEGSRFISVADEAGTVTAYMSPQGEVSGRELTITGQAAVDTLQVGGLSLEEVIELNAGLAAYAATPQMTHAAGFSSVALAETDWVTLPAGVYLVSWPVHMRLYRDGSTTVAASARVTMMTRTPGSTETTPYTWWEGDDRLLGYQSLSGSDAYFFSDPSGIFTLDEDTECRFYLGSQNTQSWKMLVYPTVFKVEKLPEALALGVTVLDVPTPPAPPKPKTVTASVGLSNIYYAYGSTFAQSGSYASGGNFYIPGAKGKTIKSIRLTGKCNFDFIDGGAGLNFPFSLGGETRTAFVRDYGTVDISFSTSGGAATALKNLGRAAFQAMSGAPTYNEYNAGSFRLTVVYQ